MKKKIIGLLLVLVIAGAIAFALYENKQVLDEAKAPKEMNLRVPVNVYTAGYGVVSDSISKVGTLQPIEEITVVSEGNGRITQLMFEEGSFVKAGQTLAVLDSDMQKAQLMAAQAQFSKAEKDYKRLSGLLERGSVTESQVEQALLGYQSAESQLLIAKKQLENMTITAGISGIVSEKKSNKGAFVGVGSPIADIVNTSTLELEIKLSEQDVSKINTGQTVSVYSELFQGELISGNVKYIAPTADKDRMYPVKISLGNLPGNKLRAGMFANVSFDWNSDKENIMIPTKAVAGEAGDNFVFVEQSGKAIRKPVTIGSISGELSSVITGLEPGEKVIITSVADLEDGSTVTLLEDTNPVEVLSNAVQEDAMVTDDIVE